jgi:hypothetical protein
MLILYSKISRCLFGFTTAKMVCQENQSRTDLVDALFNARDESEVTIDRLSGTPTSHKNRTHDATYTHKASKSVQTLDSRISERSQTNTSQQTESRNTSIKVTNNNNKHNFFVC